MADASGGLIDSIVQLPGEFATIATQSPEQAVLLLVGALVIGVSAVGFGLLATAGVVDALVSGLPSGGRPPRQA